MIMDLKFSRKDPTPFGVKSHRARTHLGSNPLKRGNNQISVQSSARHTSKYIRLLEDERVRRWIDYVARGSSITA